MVLDTLAGVAFGGVFVLIGGVAAVTGATQLWRAYQFSNTEPDTVAEAASGGRASLQGTAASADETLTAPFSGTDCLAFEYQIKEYRDDRDDPGGDWRLLDSGRLAVPFLLRCGDGDVLVEADRDPELYLGDDRDRLHVGSGETPPERVRAFVEEETDRHPKRVDEFDLGPVSVGTGRRRRYTEVRLEPDETAFVAGRADSPGADAPDRAAAVVGPDETDDGAGLLARARGYYRQIPFTVSDAPLGETAKRSIAAGVLLVVLGGVFVGVGVLAV